MLDMLSPAATEALLHVIDARVAEQVASIARAGGETPWMSVAEAATYLRTTPAAIRKRVSRGQFKAYRPEGSRIILHRDDLDGAGPPLREVL